MDSLPAVVLHSILLQVKLQSEGRRYDLLNCSRVSRAWHHAGLPVLYGIVTLDVPRLKTFEQCFFVDTYGGYIKSLTLRMEGDYGLDRHPSSAQEPHPELCERLQRLVTIINKMPNLASFSIAAAPTGYCIVSRQDIAALLDSLPPSCKSLEIDTRGTDRCTLEDELQGTGHVCESVRRLLPQLVHLRFRTTTMCPALFHAGVTEEDIEIQPAMLSEDGFVSMPAIRSVIINCGRAYVGLNDRCRVHNIPRFMKGPNHFAWATMTETIERMLAVSKARYDSASNPATDLGTRASAWLREPDSVKILVIGHTDYHDDTDETAWAAVVRADMVKKESWVIPIRQIWHGEIPDSWLIRLPDGREILGTSSRVQDLAADEAENWLDLFDGARLPRRILSGINTRGQMASLAELCGGLSGVRPDVPSLKTTLEWQQAHPRKMAMHWVTERKYGSRIINAEKRVGKEDYKSLRMIFEAIPES